MELGKLSTNNKQKRSIQASKMTTENFSSQPKYPKFHLKKLLQYLRRKISASSAYLRRNIHQIARCRRVLDNQLKAKRNRKNSIYSVRIRKQSEDESLKNESLKKWDSI